VKAARAVFGDNFVPELQEILTSTSTVTTSGPDGTRPVTTEQPYTYPWRLRWIGYDQGSGSNRVTCGLEADGKTVTAIIDAADFRQDSQNYSRTRTWNNHS
jgi:hypothetical protein